MLETIKQAAENFCTHQIQEPCTTQDGTTQKRTLIAYIDIETVDKIKYRVYVASDKEFVQKVAKLFLEEDNSDDETLQDMTLEMTNLIIGSAKVLAQAQNSHAFTIETPKFVQDGAFDFPVDKAKTCKVGDAELTLAIKELDA